MRKLILKLKKNKADDQISSYEHKCVLYCITHIQTVTLFEEKKVNPNTEKLFL